MPRFCADSVCVLTLALAFQASGIALANGPGFRTHAKRPGLVAMPTGCAPGEGPQYQSYSPALGRIVREAKGIRVDFDPIAIARRAAFLCTSQVSGTATCKNACAQLWIANPRSTGNNVDDPRQHAQCVKICAGVPTFSRLKPGELENRTNFYPNATR